VLRQSFVAGAQLDPRTIVVVDISTGSLTPINTPNEGLSLLIRRIYIDGADLTIVGYTNPQGTLNRTTVLADLAQPSLSHGYAPILLDGNWSDDGNGVALYQHSAGVSNDGYGNPAWFATGSWSGPMTGIALIDAAAGKILHFMDLKDGAGNPTSFVAAAGKKYAVSIVELITSSG